MALGLLLILFRNFERWLHQHIFKVGWLLTNDFQTTTVLYYLVFLPGILLHEFSLWLAAGILNVRADRAIQFPQEQEIGELKLNFIRLSPHTGAVRLAIIALVPLSAGMFALWAIAVQVFQWESTIDIAANGTVDAISQAVTALTRTTDFWLWFYLAFAVANTMFPVLPNKLSARRKATLAIMIPAIFLIVWRASDAVRPDIARSIEGLLNSLALVTLQVTIFNIFVVIILGVAEAIIERVSGKSATFADGKMITMSRQEAKHLKASRSRESAPSQRQQSAHKRASQPTSIYDLKLPIPGPPGREPISRSVVAVVNLQDSAAEFAVEALEIPEPPQNIPVLHQAEVERPKITPAELTERDDVEQASRSDAASRKPQTSDKIDEAVADAANAPFSRPFASQSRETEIGYHLDDDSAETEDSLFPRPFAMKTRGDEDSDDGSKAQQERRTDVVAPAKGRSSNANDKSHKAESTAFVSITRPSPKPSDKAADPTDELAQDDDGELSYEPIVDVELYDDDEEHYDDTL